MFLGMQDFDFAQIPP